MKFTPTLFILIVIIFPFYGCQKANKSTNLLDNKSYINDFELVQENPTNETSIKIKSPKAIIDPTSNDIEIFESSIEVKSKNGQDFLIRSGNSSLNNLLNYIRVFNNVNISFLDRPDYSIFTNSFKWDLNNSVININNSLNINFDNTSITATNGLFNIDSSLLIIDNTVFKRSIYNPNANDQYNVEIKSDFAKWFKKKNTLVFTSNGKQVETTINFLTTK